MFSRTDTVRLTATCDFCWTINTLTITDVPDEQQVHCSTCGGALGSLGELKHRHEEIKPRQPDRTVAHHA
jgi:hypothetical protein